MHRAHFALAFMGVSSLCACTAASPLAGHTSGAPPRNEILHESEQDPGLIASGRELVVRECSSCHAIDQGSKSPNPDAPPMKSLLARYDPEMLADDLIEGIRVGHNEMPHFDFNVIGADSLVAYLKSISKPR